jgi:hypothetical protein
LHHPECPDDKDWNTPDGCSYSAYRGPDGVITKCPCPGWPITPVPLKTRGKKGATEQIEIETQPEREKGEN